jgi:hypothetical protein
VGDGLVLVREARVIGTTAYVGTGPTTGFVLGSISTIGGCPDLVRGLGLLVDCAEGSTCCNVSPSDASGLSVSGAPFETFDLNNLGLIPPFQIE